ncbi:MAG: lipid A phosphate methyltransferase, partial [Bacteroidales bacterium]|nr:lipid A phosphate methyltransferase [Bacteroidales bacterium]
MGLSETLERQGGNLFRWRGHIPVILFLAVIPVLYFNRDNEIVPLFNHMITAAAVLICLAGFVVRAWTIGTTPKGTSGRNTREQVAET